MNRRLRLVLALTAAFLAAARCVPRAAAQERREDRDEREERRERPRAKPKVPPKAKPKPQPKPKPAPKPAPPRPAPPRAPQRRGGAERERRRAPARPAPPPAAKPQPVSPAPPAPRRPVPPPAAGKPKSAYLPPAVPMRPLPRPAPIRRPGQFATGGSPPAPPATSASGAPIAATPISRPPLQHATIVDNRTVTTTIISSQQNETVPDRYYWHEGGGVRWVHCYHDGAHWYGFWAGPDYYWARWHAGRWWWYDRFFDRYLYFNAGWWWWQDPNQPQAVYVYANDAYVPYEAAERLAASTPTTVVGAAPAAPAAPAVPAAPAYSSDADSPSFALAQDPEAFALVIGVEDYASLPKAEFAERDALAVRAHFAALGVPDRNLVLLVSTEAARASVQKFVEGWLPDHVDAGSRVYVYFSGHGAPDPKTGQTYLMPWDGDAKYLAQTGLPVKDLYAKLNSLAAKEVVIVLDACFSGAGGRSVLPAGARPLVTKADVGRDAAGRAVVFSATSADEITGTAPGQGHGLFTYYFLKGLDGAARAEKEGVTVQDLYDYLSANVEDAARRDHRDQTPQLFVPPDGRRGLVLKPAR